MSSGSLEPIELRFNTQKAKQDLAELERTYFGAKARMEANPINVGVGGNPGGGRGRRGTSGPTGAGTGGNVGSSGGGSSGGVADSAVGSALGNYYASSAGGMSVPDRSYAREDSYRQAFGASVFRALGTSEIRATTVGYGGMGGGQRLLGAGGSSGGGGGSGPFGIGGYDPDGGGGDDGTAKKTKSAIRGFVAFMVMRTALQELTNISKYMQASAVAGNSNAGQAAAGVAFANGMPIGGPILSLLTASTSTTLARAEQQETFQDTVFNSESRRVGVRASTVQASAGNSFSTVRRASEITNNYIQKRNQMSVDAEKEFREQEKNQTSPEKTDWKGMAIKGLLIGSGLAPLALAYNYLHTSGGGIDEGIASQNDRQNNTLRNRLAKGQAELSQLNAAQRRDNLIDSAYDLGQQRAQLTEQAMANRYQPLGGAIAGSKIRIDTEDARFKANQAALLSAPGGIVGNAMEIQADQERHAQNIGQERNNLFATGKQITDNYLYGNIPSGFTAMQSLDQFNDPRQENLTNVLQQLADALRGTQPAGGSN